MENMGNLLRLARDAAGFTQAELAELISSDERSIRRWESGKLPNRYYQQRLCAVLHKTPEELGFITAMPVVRLNNPPQQYYTEDCRKEKVYEDELNAYLRPWAGCIPVLVVTFTVVGVLIWVTWHIVA